jgi:hypothetical protein
VGQVSLWYQLTTNSPSANCEFAACQTSELMLSDTPVEPASSHFTDIVRDVVVSFGSTKARTIIAKSSGFCMNTNDMRLTHDVGLVP